MDSKKIISALKHAAAEFVNIESNRRSLITVTKVELDEQGKHASIFVSVYPGEQSRAALDFLARSRVDFAQYLKKHVHMRLPKISFLHDPNIGGFQDIDLTIK